MNDHKHILNPFEQDIDNLIKLIKTIMDEVSNMINLSCDSLLKLDVQKAKECIKLDRNVDTLHVDINELGIEILTRYSPVASDLRTVVASMRVSSDFERIGDQAVNIAKRIKNIAKRTDKIDKKEINNLFDPVKKMYKNSCSALLKENVKLADDVIKMDNIVDDNYKASLKLITNNLKENINTIKKNIEMSFISRYLERMGDLSCNIAKEAIFKNTGEKIN